MFDPDGNVTEATINSVYFYRNNRWVTPRVTCLDKSEEVMDFVGGQRGVTRRWALEKGLCVEDDISVTSITNGEVVWLSNGGRGFGVGYIKEL
jgi:4-amino-4-deoxychorismate lyase